MIQGWLIKQLPHLLAVSVMLGLIFWLVAYFKEQGRAELRPIIERLQIDLESERAARIRNEEALNAYQNELDGLRNRPRPTSPVRLCVTPPVSDPDLSPGGFTGATALTGSSAGHAGGDLVAGPDIGPALRGLAYGCDAENAKLRALQNWVRSVVQ